MKTRSSVNLVKKTQNYTITTFALKKKKKSVMSDPYTPGSGTTEQETIELHVQDAEGKNSQCETVLGETPQK